MLHNQFNKILKIKQIAGVELFLKPDGTRAYQAVIVALKNGKLQQLDSKTDMDHVDQLQLFLGKTPSVLCITGKGIVVKKLTNTDDATPEIKEILPYANPDDFVLHTPQSTHRFKWRSFARKDLVDSIIDELMEGEINILDLFIGPQVAGNIISFFDDFQQSIIQLPAYNIHVAPEGINNIANAENEETEYAIQGSSLTNKLLISFALAFTFLTFQRGKTSSSLEQVRKNSEEYRFKKLKMQVGWIAAIVLLIVLFVNFFIYNHYHEKLNAINQEALYQRNLINQVETLQKQFNDKSQLLRESGLMQKPRIAFYADRLAALRSDGISFETFSVYPVEISRGNNDFSIDRTSIIIQGIANSGRTINNWIRQIDTLSWVNNTHLIDLKYSLPDKKTKFDLKIQLKND